MALSLFNKGSLPVILRMNEMANTRHQILANNIANAETGGYKAKDVPIAEFQMMLKDAMEERDRRPVRVFDVRETFDIHKNVRNQLIFDTVETNEGVLGHNGNNVDMDSQMKKLAENLLYHRTTTSLATHHFRMLLDAIQTT